MIVVPPAHKGLDYSMCHLHVVNDTLTQPQKHSLGTSLSLCTSSCLGSLWVAILSWSFEHYQVLKSGFHNQHGDTPNTLAIRALEFYLVGYIYVFF